MPGSHYTVRWDGAMSVKCLVQGNTASSVGSQSPIKHTWIIGVRMGVVNA